MAYDTEIKNIPIIESNRFSNFVRAKDKAGLRELEKWVEWFKRDGIDAVIGFTASGYAVYRVGLINEE